jgi:hypothetical protein
MDSPTGQSVGRTRSSRLREVMSSFINTLRRWHLTVRGYRCFGGLRVATRRRIFRRNPDNTVNLNQPSVTLDIGNVELHYANEQGRP